jgi:hypothetical protein
MLALKIDSRSKEGRENRGVNPHRQFGKNGRECDLSFGEQDGKYGSV